jgi:hypothetical protein
LKITYEGAGYEFDMDQVTVRQAIKIEKHLGCSFAEWGEQLAKGGAMKALQVLGWLILFGGRDVAIEDADFKMVPFGDAVNAAMVAEAAAAPDAGPTAAAGNGRPAAGTLVLSPLSSETVSP